MPDRVSSGIPGFDELVEGGFPRGSVILLTGGPGTGKTTFSSQFLWEGIQNGEKSLYITTEELPQEIKNDAKQFGWDFESVEPEKFSMENMEPSDSTEYLPQNVREIMREEDYDRIVLDSISVFGIYWEGKRELRRNMNDLIKQFRKVDATVLMTAELPNEESGKLSRYGVAEFIADGVVKMEVVSIGKESFGNLKVRKMRRTDIQRGEYETLITENGLKIGDETIDLK
jgi:KaiC/GvpD/RAD55 family RecA-like ATPase